MQRADPIVRFWSHVDIKGPDECWPWINTRKRYVRFWLDGKSVQATHFSYQLHYGVDPGDFFVCHTCDNPLCVNPNHLFLGTSKQNTQDMIEKGRSKLDHTGNAFRVLTGSLNNQTVLTDEEVDEIRSTYQRNVRGFGIRTLAHKYNVATNTIYQIVNNLTRR